MAQPVWILSVDLQAKTATFQSGMADAARSARGAFTEIGSGSGAMGREVGGNMMEARHGVMMLGEEFGIHLPRGLTTFIASLGPVGAAMETAFPFLAIILGATLLLEHLAKLKEAGVKLTEDQERFGTAVQNAFNMLDEKIDAAKIKADELRGDHLGALKLQLELIDKQSMAELVHSFGEVAKAADTVFADIKSHWYTFGIGSTGAKHALDEFQTKYDSLLAQGKDKEASDLLKGTRESAEKVLALQKQFASTAYTGGDGSDEAWASSMKHEEARQALKQYGLGTTEKELAAQQALVEALDAQVSVEQRVAELKKLDGANAKTADAKADGAKAAEAARKALEAEKRASEEAKKFYDDAYRTYVQSVDEGERNLIDATKQGSAARLAAIDAAIKEETEENLQGTSFYRELLTERVNLVREMAEEEAKLRADAAKESADNDEKMAMLALARDKEQTALADSAQRLSAAQRVDEETKAADAEYDIKAAALQKEIAALDEFAKDYGNKLQALLDKENQMTREHANENAAIKNKAIIASNTAIMAEAQRFNDTLNAGLTQVLMGHESFAKMMDSIGNQVVSGMMQNALKTVEANLIGKESEAAKAARAAYNIGIGYGGPAGMVLGPVFAALAFSTVSGFEKGGIVPGVGRGDIVPAMLTPGEAVLPKSLVERLSSGGSTSNSTHYHAHVNPTYNLQALDSSGMEHVLDTHTDTLTKHFEDTIRRMNK